MVSSLRDYLAQRAYPLLSNFRKLGHLSLSLRQKKRVPLGQLSPILTLNISRSRGAGFRPCQVLAAALAAAATAFRKLLRTLIDVNSHSCVFPRREFPLQFKYRQPVRKL